jgi:hypothetical protein
MDLAYVHFFQFTQLSAAHFDPHLFGALNPALKKVELFRDLILATSKLIPDNYNPICNAETSDFSQRLSSNTGNDCYLLPSHLRRFPCLLRLHLLCCIYLAA